MLSEDVNNIAKSKMSTKACRWTKLRALLLDRSLTGKLLVNPGELLLLTNVGLVGLALSGKCACLGGKIIMCVLPLSLIEPWLTRK